MPYPRLLLRWLFVLSFACLPLVVVAAGEPSVDVSFLLENIEERCSHCHGGDETHGDVDLAELQSVQAIARNPHLLQQIYSVLRNGEMPPDDEPPLPEQDRQRMIDTLRSLRDQNEVEAAAVPHVMMRRMNRFQYANAVRDLLGLRCEIYSLPEKMMRIHRNYFRPASGKMADVVHVGSRPLGKSQMIEPRLAGVAPFPQDLRAEHGFDNRGDHLSLSPLLMESFLRLGQSITHSPDFEKRRVGVWDSLFRAPKSSDENRARIQRFLTKAFRRPPSAETTDRYVAFLEHELAEGKEYTAVMRKIVAAVLASPQFIYLYDQATSDQEAAPESLDDFELASRLSFFLWGSIPDQVLLDAAKKGELSDREFLAQQVDRMLRDPKIKRFCDSFPSQWLQLERIISSVPNREMFPAFYFSKYRNSMHMMMEPLLLFETVLIENKPILNFLHSDFSYRSVRLQNAYGQPLDVIPGRKNGGEVTQLTFYRVPVTDARYGGLITNAAVMTMTSGPERTQPITRGAWMATVMFNDPPDPPPADVPPLPEKAEKDQEHLTLRERLSAHRQRADCRGCHEQIDPLGFALENYSPVGTWRDRYENGREVDMEGTLFGKHKFDDIAAFKEAIMGEKQRFSEGFAGHLLSFALARELEPFDQPVLEKIAARAASDDYRLQTFIHEIVLSRPFQYKSPKPHPYTGVSLQLSSSDRVQESENEQ